jgi:pilus assembly protein CpaF
MTLGDAFLNGGRTDVTPLELRLDGHRDRSLHERLGEAPQIDQRATDPYAALKTRVHQACIDRIGASLFRSTQDADLRRRVETVVAEQLHLDVTPLTAQELEQLVGEISDDVLGYGPLEPLLADSSVTEIMVNGFDEIYVERRGRLELTSAAFIDEEHLLRIIDRIVSRVGRRIDEASPMVDARLPDGSRVNAIIAPLSLTGPVLTVRKFSREFFSLDDLVDVGTLSPAAAAFLGACVRGKLNVLISGGTGAGKTTLLNALSAYIPEAERIITIEDAAELQLQQRHVVRLEARPPNVEGSGEIRIRELVRNALRMRPDRMVVGEVRGAETIDMLQAMNTGHEGSLTTIHANSPRDALSRLELLVLTAGVDLPLRAIREQIASAFDLVVQVTRLIDGTRRVSSITEVLGMESEIVTLQELFTADPEADDPGGRRDALLRPLAATGLVPHLSPKLAAHGVTLDTRLFDEDAHGDMTIGAYVWRPPGAAA